MNKYVLKNESLTVTISDTGAEVLSIINNKGIEIIHQGSKVYPQHSPICFPIIGCFPDDTYTFNGKDYGLTIHGFAKKALFDVEEISDTEISFKISSTPETLASYPFEFNFTVNYKLEGSDFITEYITENIGENTMYYAVGTHTGYKIDNGLKSYRVRFENGEDKSKLELLPINYRFSLDEIMDNGIIKLDDIMFAKGCFTLGNLSKKQVVLEDNCGGKIVKIDFSDFDYITFWSAPDEKYICIEPWTYQSSHYTDNSVLEKQNGITALMSGNRKKQSHTFTVY